MTIYIGDVHGYFNRYKKIIEQCQDSVQVGDMGVGFLTERGEPSANPPHYAMKQGNHRFIRGNHDNLCACRKHSQWISDGTIEDGTMYIGGAFSIDRAWRTEGYNWWPDEEMSISELFDIVDLYIENKPEVVITHDCPETVADIMCAHTGVEKFSIPSRTRQALDSMWSSYSPRLWVFGHWHRSFDQVLNGTRFVCLNELEVRDL